MTTSIDRKRQRDVQLVSEVDSLGEEVKTLALNLAIYLAKAKTQGGAEALNRMEPDFIRLVNGTVHVVQEMTMILNAARNMERMIYDVPSGDVHQDRLEMRLRSLLEQCSTIVTALTHLKSLDA